MFLPLSMAKDPSPTTAPPGFLDKLRQHWLAVLLLILGGGVVLLLLLTALYFGIMSPDRFMAGKSAESLAAMDSSYRGYGMPSYGGSGNFAPEQQARQIEKSASLTTEIERGTYDAAEDRLQGIVADVNGFILTSNVGSYGTDTGRSGTYALKIPSQQYAGTIERLRQIGELDSFTESAVDVTGQMTDAQVELAAERSRLQRYKDLYGSYGSLSDKMQLDNYIFEQERRIQYLEQSLKETGQLVQYTTVTVTLREPGSSWAHIGFVGLSDLIRTLVESTKALLYFVVAVLPWLVLAALIWWLVVIMRRKLA
jgi:hypothetical protein